MPPLPWVRRITSCNNWFPHDQLNVSQMMTNLMFQYVTGLWVGLEAWMLGFEWCQFLHWWKQGSMAVTFQVTRTWLPGACAMRCSYYQKKQGVHNLKKQNKHKTFTISLCWDWGQCKKWIVVNLFSFLMLSLPQEHSQGLFPHGFEHFSFDIGHPMICLILSCQITLSSPSTTVLWIAVSLVLLKLSLLGTYLRSWLTNSLKIFHWFA